MCPSDGAELREQYGNREQRLLAETPFRQREGGGRPGLLDLICQESRQALKLRDGPIDEGGGGV